MTNSIDYYIGWKIIEFIKRQLFIGSWYWILQKSLRVPLSEFLIISECFLNSHEVIRYCISFDVLDFELFIIINPRSYDSCYVMFLNTSKIFVYRISPLKKCFIFRTKCKYFLIFRERSFWKLNKSWRNNSTDSVWELKSLIQKISRDQMSRLRLRSCIRRIQNDPLDSISFIVYLVKCISDPT